MRNTEKPSFDDLNVNVTSSPRFFVLFYDNPPKKNTGKKIKKKNILLIQTHGRNLQIDLRSHVAYNWCFQIDLVISHKGAGRDTNFKLWFKFGYVSDVSAPA